MREPIRFLRATYGGLPATTWLVCAAAFVNRAGSMVLPFLQVYLGQRFGYTVAEAGLILSLYGIGSILGNLVGGWLADHLGPVRTQIAALLAAACWMGIMAFATTPWAIAAGTLLLGTFNDMFRPGNLAAVVGSCAPPLRVKALTLNRLAINAGWAIGPAIGGQLAHYDYRWLFAADGLSSALAALVLAVFLRGRDRASAPARNAPGADPAPASAPSPWRDLRFLVLLALSVLTLLTFMQYFTTETRYLKEVFGFDERTIGLLLSINPVLIVLFEMPLVHALRGRPQLPIVALGTVWIALAFPLLVPVAWGRGGVIASLLVLTVGEMFYSPFLGAFVSDCSPAAARGRYLGLYGASFALALVVAPSSGGFVYDLCGADALWFGAGALGLLAAAGFVLLHRVHHRAAPVAAAAAAVDALGRTPAQ